MIKMDDEQNTWAGGATNGLENRLNSADLSGQIIRTADTNQAKRYNGYKESQSTEGWGAADFICIYFRGWDGALSRIHLLNAISCEMNQSNNSRTVSYYNKEYKLSKSRLKDVLDLWSFIGLVDKRTDRYTRYSGNVNKIKYVMEELSESKLLPRFKSYTTPNWSTTIESICSNIDMDSYKILENYDTRKRVDWYGNVADDEGPD